MNLWQVEHFLSDLLWDQSKSEEKGSIGQKFICSEVTSYKIHILTLQPEGWWLDYAHDIHILFIYSEKATTFCEISTLLLTGTT